VDNPRNLMKTLSEMWRESLWESHSNQVEAAAKMREKIQDRRSLDQYDPARLQRRVESCWSNGASLELDDPQLQRGGRPRPGDRWR